MNGVFFYRLYLTVEAKAIYSLVKNMAHTIRQVVIFDDNRIAKNHKLSRGTTETAVSVCQTN